MNLNVLYELNDRLEAIVISGVNLLGEDFRLKRAIEQIEPLATVNPVFGKIYQMCQQLLEIEEAQRAIKVLEILALLGAVLCTQGAVNVEGEITALPERAGNIVVDMPYSVLNVLKSNLTGTGSGRYAIIRDFLSSEDVALDDERVRHELIRGLNDSYAELAELIKDWLIAHGNKTLIPLLKEGFDPTGKKDMVRRIQVIGALAGEEENGFYCAVYEEASADVKKALLHIMRKSQANADFLLDTAKSEKGSVKKHVLYALSNMDTPEAAAYMAGVSIRYDNDFKVYVTGAESDWTSDMLVNKLSDNLNVIIDEKETLENRKNAFKKMNDMRRSWRGKTSPAMMQFYKALAEHLSVLDHFCDLCDFHCLYHSLLESTLIDALLFSQKGVDRVGQLIVELAEMHQGLFLKSKAVYDLLTIGADAFYDKYHEMLEKGMPFKSDYYEKNMIADLFTRMDYSQIDRQYVFYYNFNLSYAMEDAYTVKRLIPEFSSKWYNSILTYAKNGSPSKKKLIHVADEGEDGWCLLDDLVMTATDEYNALIGDALHQHLLKHGATTELVQILRNTGWTEYQGIFVQSVKKRRQMSSKWDIERLIRCIPLKAEDYIKEIEEVLRLPIDKDRLPVSLLEYYLTELKAGEKPEELPIL